LISGGSTIGPVRAAVDAFFDDEEPDELELEEAAFFGFADAALLRVVPT